MRSPRPRGVTTAHNWLFGGASAAKPSATTAKPKPVPEIRNPAPTHRFTATGPRPIVATSPVALHNLASCPKCRRKLMVMQLGPSGRQILSPWDPKPEWQEAYTACITDTAARRLASRQEFAERFASDHECPAGQAVADA